ncbi:hypothetical protein AA106_13150 [Photorhabdus laumondii subsp. laumondii]|nr:hypothetical protein AA106_13150 [Photorhabdus laumondii subsp. laumondii]
MRRIVVKRKSTYIYIVKNVLSVFFVLLFCLPAGNDINFQLIDVTQGQKTITVSITISQQPVKQI